VVCLLTHAQILDTRRNSKGLRRGKLLSDLSSRGGDWFADRGSPVRTLVSKSSSSGEFMYGGPSDAHVSGRGGMEGLVRGEHDERRGRS
jgi:hypothetical protein